jgi:protein gp37
VNLAAGKYWDVSWNPIQGCTPASEGCHNCWARAVVERFHGGDFARVGFHPTRLAKPYTLRASRVIFACDLTDWCHPEVRPSWVDAMLRVMLETSQHRYLLLTKRPERMLAQIYEPSADAPHRLLQPGQVVPNLALGITAENHARLLERWSAFAAPAALRWLSLEPLLGPIDGELARHMLGSFAWVVAGAESLGGRPGRVCQLEWIEDLVGRCDLVETPVFVKQAHRGGLVRAPEIRGRQRLALPKFFADGGQL